MQHFVHAKHNLDHIWSLQDLRTSQTVNVCSWNQYCQWWSASYYKQDILTVFFMSFKLVVEWELRDDNKKDLFCIRFPVQIVNWVGQSTFDIFKFPVPETIKSSSLSRRFLVCVTGSPTHLWSGWGTRLEQHWKSEVHSCLGCWGWSVWARSHEAPRLLRKAAHWQPQRDLTPHWRILEKQGRQSWRECVD